MAKLDVISENPRHILYLYQQDEGHFTDLKFYKDEQKLCDVIIKITVSY